MLLSRGARSLRAIMATGAVCLYALAAHAHSTGVTTLSFDSRGCNQCHIGGQVPPVQLHGPTLVAPGSTNEYTLEVSAIGDQDEGGLNVSATTGILTTGGNDSSSTKVLPGTGDRNEITHSFPKAAVDGTITFTFLWTAPSPGSAMLSAWGGAMNGNFKRSGDKAASADLTISVRSTEPTACVVDCDGGGGVTIDESLILVDIALGSTDAAACPTGVPSTDAVDVALIIQSVNNALNGCVAAPQRFIP